MKARECGGKGGRGEAFRETKRYRERALTGRMQRGRGREVATRDIGDRQREERERERERHIHIKYIYIQAYA